MTGTTQRSAVDIELALILVHRLQYGYVTATAVFGVVKIVVTGVTHLGCSKTTAPRSMSNATDRERSDGEEAADDVRNKF